jgi:uncharacterized protein (DUF1499 family)
MKPPLGYPLIGFTIASVIAALLLLTPLGDRPLEALFPVRYFEPIDFVNLQLTGSPNQFLACPPNYCTAKVHVNSETFEASVNQLRSRWLEVVTGEPRVELLAQVNGLQFDHVQRSAHFRFPDIVTVRFIQSSPTRSMLAIYSRSVYGNSDFGVNRKRIEGWLGKIRAKLR